MKAKEVREKTAEELTKLEDKLRQELAGLRIQSRSGQLAETSKIDAMKRDIARILTIRTQGQKKQTEGKAKR